MVKFSDLSGEIIPDDAVARIVVHEHPELTGGPVEIEVQATEALAAEKAAVPVAVVELHMPGSDEPRRVALDVDAFDKMATDRTMSELLIAARPARRAPRASRASTGEPKRGKGAHLAAADPVRGKAAAAEAEEPDAQLAGQTAIAV
jgi:hypothetical protein